MKIVALSPHLDDTIFSIGSFLSTQNDVTIITIFAGIPKNKGVLTVYDQKAGFESAEDAVSTRREENKQACSNIGAKQIDLNFPDAQYAEGYTDKAILTTLQTYIDDQEPELLFIPLGFMHPDHVQTREVGVKLAFNNGIIFKFYEDLPYRVTYPIEAVDTLRKLEEEYDLGLEIPNAPLTTKLSAITCYRSQLNPDSDLNIHNLCVPERMYSVSKK